MSDIIVGLDIGTSFVRAAIGEIAENNTVEITGIGKYPSTGIRNGAVVNIQATISAINKAIEAAEMIAGHTVVSCFLGVGGSQIGGRNSVGVASISSTAGVNKVVKQNDISRAIEVAAAINFPMGREILAIIPQMYKVDDQLVHKDDLLDTMGSRLEVNVHIITASETLLRNFEKCVEIAGYRCSKITAKTLAATHAVMTEEEKELGSILIDLGGGSTDILVLQNGAPIFTGSVPLGGINVTKDISIVRGISADTAEKIKISSGACWAELVEDSNEEVIIPGVGGRPPESISRSDLCEIIQPRMEEIFAMTRDKIVQEISLTQLFGNVVITGGGAALPGVTKLAANVFGRDSVRIGLPVNLGKIDPQYRMPEYATVAGLVIGNAPGLNSDKGNPEKKDGFAKKIGDFLREFF